MCACVKQRQRERDRDRKTERQRQRHKQRQKEIDRKICFRDPEAKTHGDISSYYFSQMNHILFNQHSKFADIHRRPKVLKIGKSGHIQALKCGLIFNQLFERNIDKKCQFTFTNIFIYISEGEFGDLITRGLQFLVRKDAKKNLKSYLLQENLLMIRKEITERTPQERGGPCQGRQWPCGGWSTWNLRQGHLHNPVGP